MSPEELAAENEILHSRIKKITDTANRLKYNNMKVFFVGIHNKPGLNPLCGSTKTGKIIDRLSLALGVETIKTNLCDIEYFPKSEDARLGAKEWHDRHNPQDDDVIVLLGQFVHNHFKKFTGKIVKLPHPAGVFGTMKREDWIARAVKEIEQAQKKISVSDTLTREQQLLSKYKSKPADHDRQPIHLKDLEMDGHYFIAPHIK